VESARLPLPVRRPSLNDTIDQNRQVLRFVALPKGGRTQVLGVDAVNVAEGVPLGHGFRLVGPAALVPLIQVQVCAFCTRGHTTRRAAR